MTVTKGTPLDSARGALNEVEWSEVERAKG
jgi:hypothetical protein